MKKNISSKDLPVFPFENLSPMKPGEGIGQKSIVDGMSFYSVLEFSTTSALFFNTGEQEDARGH